MDRITLRKIENYFKQKFNNKKIKIEGRANKNDSAEVLIDDEFIGGLVDTAKLFLKKGLVSSRQS